jgi:glycosyltransferase involved in cell wall biosynthesis
MSAVSILTITQYKRSESLKLLLKSIKNQIYRNITEWVIVEGSQNIEEATLNQQLINNLDYNIKYVPFVANSSIGDLRNRCNSNASGDYLIIMDDDDYYFNTYVDHCVIKLGGAQIAGCGSIFIYDIITNKLYKNNSMDQHICAYRKTYTLNHTFDNNNFNTFTNNYSEYIEKLLSECLLIKIIHNNNHFFNRVITLGTTMNVVNNLVDSLLPEMIEYLIPKDIFDEYKKIFMNDEILNYDIVYLAGTCGISWLPTDKHLGGSEQAIVELTKELGKTKRIVVFGEFNCNIRINNVDFIHWTKFPFDKQIKTLIGWRKCAIQILLNNEFKADKLLLDFHDNLSYTLSDINSELLGKLFNKVTYFMFKSNFHQKCFIDFIQSKNIEVSNDKYKIIPNGIRIEDFSINNNYIRNPYRLCYCSSYDRGLEHILLYIWPIIIKMVPSAEFHVYYGMDYIYDNNFKDKMNKLINQPGVIHHGRQSMEEIIKEKYMSTFQLYLNNAFSEIDCINIKESLITGCIPIISKSGVFAERHGLQFDLDLSKYNHEQLPEVYHNISLDIINKMNDNNFIIHAREILKKSDTIISWSQVANLWLELF